MGTVTKITDQSITIETKDKKTTEVALSPETKYMILSVLAQSAGKMA